MTREARSVAVKPLIDESGRAIRPGAGHRSQDLTLSGHAGDQRRRRALRNAGHRGGTTDETMADPIDARLSSVALPATLVAVTAHVTAVATSVALAVYVPAVAPSIGDPSPSHR